MDPTKELEDVLVMHLASIHAKLDAITAYLTSTDQQFTRYLTRRQKDTFSLQVSAVGDYLADIRALIREHGPVRFPTLREFGRKMRQSKARTGRHAPDRASSAAPAAVRRDPRKRHS